MQVAWLWGLGSEGVTQPLSIGCTVTTLLWEFDLSWNQHCPDGHESETIVSENPARSSHQDLAGMTACLLVDGQRVTAWQSEALQLAISRGLRISGVFMCTGQSVRRRPLTHLGYYLLRLTSMRTKPQISVPWRPIVGDEATITSFSPDMHGNWQRIPAQTLDEIGSLDPDVIIKFGMKLLRDPDQVPARHGVLSFHHGDPAQYRGRPAGFYEMLHGASHVGAMVQRLSNTLDAGAVLALSSHQLVAHSYSQTLDGLYGNSSCLLVKAMINARQGISIDHPVDGPNYRLPSNGQVLRFVALLTKRKLSRAVYGATRTKRWTVGLTELADPGKSAGTVTLPTPSAFPVPPGFRFLADPLPGPGDSIWCEAMDSKTGLGRIMAITPGEPARVIEPPGTTGLHLAYPFVVESEGISYLIPEMSGGGPARIFTLDGLDPVDPRPLLGLENERLVDPTLHRYQSRWWLFAGKPGSAAELLWLWSSPQLHGPYEDHPANPIVMDPSRARPGGPLFVADGRLFRPGQNNSGAYGNGLTVSEVSKLSLQEYVERPAFQLRIGARRGPHTLVHKENQVIVDSYLDALDPLAWLHRVRNQTSGTIGLLKRRRGH
jgi:hypothetical protein